MALCKKVWELSYSHDSIRNKFHNEQFAEALDAILSVKNGKILIDLNELDPIEVSEFNNKLYAMDGNRRLYMYKFLYKYGIFDGNVPVKFAAVGKYTVQDITSAQGEDDDVEVGLRSLS